MYYDPVEGRVVHITTAESDALGLTRSEDKCYLTVNKKPNNRYLFNINVSKSVGRGAEISFFVTNVFDDASIYQNCFGTYYIRNPDIFYGVEFSTILDDLWKRSPAEGK
jgi:hypothetical protein